MGVLENQLWENETKKTLIATILLSIGAILLVAFSLDNFLNPGLVAFENLLSNLK